MDNLVYNNISDIATKRIKTAFIYSVFALEEEMGHLWGEGKNETDPLTPEEQKMFDIFMKWRKIMMDFGHKQMRICDKEIKMAFVKSNGVGE